MSVDYSIAEVDLAVVDCIEEKLEKANWIVVAAVDNQQSHAFDANYSTQIEPTLVVPEKIKHYVFIMVLYVNEN